MAFMFSCHSCWVIQRNHSSFSSCDCPVIWISGKPDGKNNYILFFIQILEHFDTLKRKNYSVLMNSMQNSVEGISHRPEGLLWSCSWERSEQMPGHGAWGTANHKGQGGVGEVESSWGPQSLLRSQQWKFAHTETINDLTPNSYWYLS